MRADDYLDTQFEERLRGGFSRSIEATNFGLVLGVGTCLARVSDDLASLIGSNRDAEQKRLFSLMAIVFGSSHAAKAMAPIIAALDDWRKGDKVVAHMRLAHAETPFLTSIDEAYRLFLAGILLDQGMSPENLLKTLKISASESDLTKYDPNQPRVPAGSGRASGRWGSGGGNSGSVSHGFVGPAAGAAARATTQTFIAEATPSMIRALALFASRFSVPTAVLGMIFIPTPNSGGVTEGSLPDMSDVRFKVDGPAGTLQLTTKAADGSDIVIGAQNQGGVYVDVGTGKPIGRNLDGQLALEQDQVREAIKAGLAPGQELAPDERSESKDDEPKLCPAPEPDTPHHASKQAMDYEDDVHARVNPLAPIPRGFGINLKDPETGRIVYYDDCFRYAGDLIEGDMQKGDLVDAKGPRYAALLKAGGLLRDKVMNEFKDQAEKQLRTAAVSGRRVKWYFAEPYAEDEVRREFANDKSLRKVVISHMSPRIRR